MLTLTRIPAVPALRGLVLLLSVLALLASASASSPARPGPAGAAHDPLIDRIILSAQAVLDRAPPAPAPEGGDAGVALWAAAPLRPLVRGAWRVVVPVAGHGPVQGRLSGKGARAPPVLSVPTA